MITSNYIVTGQQRTTRFYLKPDALATGFVGKACRYLEREKAERAAERENASGIWGFTWSVIQQQFDVKGAQQQ